MEGHKDAHTAWFWGKTFKNSPMTASKENDKYNLLPLGSILWHKHWKNKFCTSLLNQTKIHILSSCCWNYQLTFRAKSETVKPFASELGKELLVVLRTVAALPWVFWDSGETSCESTSIWAWESVSVPHPVETSLTRIWGEISAITWRQLSTADLPLLLLNFTRNLLQLLCRQKQRKVRKGWTIMIIVHGQHARAFDWLTESFSGHWPIKKVCGIFFSFACG